MKTDLVVGGTELGREGKVGSCISTIVDDRPQFINNVALPNAVQVWTGESMGDDFRVAGWHKFSDFGNAVADEVVQKRTGQRSNPVATVTQKRLAVGWVVMGKALHAFHVDRRL